MKNNFTVYKHITPSNKIYIGITSRKPEERWNSGNGYKHNSHFYNAIKKYGWDNIKHEILFTNLTQEEAELKEMELIKKYNTRDHNIGYNVEKGGNFQGTHSEEIKLKISKNNKGKNKGENHPMYGKHLSEEMKNKLSKSLKGKCKGEKNGMYGKTLSEEVLNEFSKKYTGSGNPMYGHHHTEKTKKRLSDFAKQKYTGSGNPMYGKKHSEESKKKMSEAAKRRHSKEKIIL